MYKIKYKELGCKMYTTVKLTIKSKQELRNILLRYNKIHGTCDR